MKKKVLAATAMALASLFVAAGGASAEPSGNACTASEHGAAQSGRPVCGDGTCSRPEANPHSRHCCYDDCLVFCCIYAGKGKPYCPEELPEE